MIKIEFGINLSSFIIREESIDPMLLPLLRLAHHNENDSILSGHINNMNSRKNKVQYVLRSRCVEILRTIEKLRVSGMSSVRIKILNILFFDKLNN